METQNDILAFPRTPADRLRLALRRLDEAVAEQARAVAEFRAGIGALRQATQSLSGSLGEYRAALDGTATQVSAANRAARQLQDTARKMAGEA